MDVERTMEFILEQQARNQTALAELISAGEKTDRRIDRLERTVARLARLGMKVRSKANGRLDEHQRRIEEHDRWFAEQKVLMHEIGEKLNALIDVVDRWPRNNPAQS
jgi:hypothetical protein